MLCFLRAIFIRREYTPTPVVREGGGVENMSLNVAESLRLGCTLDALPFPRCPRDARRTPPIGATARSPPSGVHRKGAGCARQLHEGSMRVYEGFSGVYRRGGGIREFPHAPHAFPTCFPHESPVLR